MTPQQWQRVKSVLAEALERKREEQSAFLDRACSADAWLRAQVEMLPSSGDRSSVLQSAALQMRLKPGTKLGEYGGMGEVYRAHDGRLGREVAIKVLPAALSGNVERLHRLNQEARTAAALNQTHSLPTLSSQQETRLENANRLPAASSPAPRALQACPAFGETRSTGGPHVIERVPGRSDNSQLAGRG